MTECPSMLQILILDRGVACVFHSDSWQNVQSGWTMDFISVNLTDLLIFSERRANVLGLNLIKY